MRTESIPKDLYIRNRGKLRKLLKPGALVVVHSNDNYPTNADGSMAFHQHGDLYHLTGVWQEETILLLMPDAADPADREILFVKKTSDEIAIWEGQKLTREQAGEASGIERVEWSGKFDDIFTRLVLQADCIYLPTNEHPRAARMVETRNDRFIRQCRERFPLHRYERLAPLTHRIRVIKEQEEIAMIRKACGITGAGFRRVLEFIEPGVGEWEIEAELLHEFVRCGSRGFAYQPIIGSGADSCVLHYVHNHKRCHDGAVVLLDVAAEYNGWNSDLTRTVPVNGRFSKRQRQVYDAVLRIMRGAMGLLRPGIHLPEYQKQVVGIVEEELIGLGLISAAAARKQGPDKAQVKKYFMHGVSHHLGIDVHDVSPPHEPLAEGMVLTVEPGIYIREENLGVRLENDILIGAAGNIDLMEDIPIEAGEIEEIMNRRHGRKNHG
jgi:Xaa-Pro aminopeptidase